MAKNNKRRNRKNRGRTQGPTTVTIRPVVATRQPRSGGARRRRRGNVLNRFPLGRVANMSNPGIAKVVGRGAYKVTNVQSNSLAGSTPPMFGPTSGATRIRHREFISDVSGSVGFAISTFQLQPGLPQLFPWLSAIAARYEQYEIAGICIEYKATSSNALAAANTALGVVGLVTQYDAHEPVFQSKQEAEHYLGCQSCSPSESMLHFVECARGQNPLDKLYVRTTNLGAGADIKFYDMGIVSLFTAGMQAVAVIGELWVSYDIIFSKPKMPTGGIMAYGGDWYSLLAPPFNAAPAVTVPTGTQPIYGTLGTSFSANNTLLIPKELPGGTYILVFNAILPIASNGAMITAVGRSAGILDVTTYFEPGANNVGTSAFAIGSGTAANSTTKFMVGYSFSVANYRNVDDKLVFTFTNYGQVATSMVIYLAQLPTMKPIAVARDLMGSMALRFENLVSQMNQLKKQLKLEPISELPITELEEDIPKYSFVAVSDDKPGAKVVDKSATKISFDQID